MDLNDNNNDNLEENEQLDENAGFTAFPGSRGYQQNVPLSGAFAAFFKSFFTTKKKRGRPAGNKDPLRGDVVKQADGEQDTSVGIGVSKGGIALPQVEYARRRRYQDCRCSCRFCT